MQRETARFAHRFRLKLNKVPIISLRYARHANCSMLAYSSFFPFPPSPRLSQPRFHSAFFAVICDNENDTLKNSPFSLNPTQNRQSQEITTILSKLCLSKVEISFNKQFSAGLCLSLNI
jgi:hypothetical protein